MSKSLNELVLTYLTKTNRPYSSTDVFNNLNTINNKVSKTAITKALEDLAAKQLINEKINGKQKVYFADQNKFESMDENKIKSMDKEIEELNQTLDKLKEEIKEKETKLNSYKNNLPLEEIQRQLSGVESETQELNKRLSNIAVKVKDLDPNQNSKVKSQRQQLVNEWKKRKRMAISMIDMIVEGCALPKKALIEEIGIETDEEAKVTVPQN